MNKNFLIDNFEQRQTKLFFDIFKYKGKEENIIKNWDKAPFTWDAVVGEAKLGNIKVFPEGVPQGTMSLPLVYIQQPNEFYPVIVEKIFSKWVEADWLNFFAYNNTSDVLKWQHRIIKFNRAEAKKQAFGTPHRKITFYEETVKGNMSFAGAAVELPYDWGTGKTSRYVAQAIIFTQLIHAVEVLLDHHKELLIETILNTQDQYYKFHINYEGRERCKLTEFLESGDFEIWGICNRSKLPFQNLIDTLTRRIRKYNPTFQSSNYGSPTLALIAPEEEFSNLINMDEYWKNSSVGHKTKEGLFNKESDPLPQFMTVKNIKLFPAKEYKTIEFPDGIQLLHSYKQEHFFNWFPDFKDIQYNNTESFRPFTYGNMCIYVHDMKAGCEKKVLYEDALKQITVNEVVSKFALENKNKMSDLIAANIDDTGGVQKFKDEIMDVFINIALKKHKSHKSWHQVLSDVKSAITSDNLVINIRKDSEVPQHMYSQVQAHQSGFSSSAPGTYKKDILIIESVIDELGRFHSELGIIAGEYVKIFKIYCFFKILSAATVTKLLSSLHGKPLAANFTIAGQIHLPDFLRNLLDASQSVSGVFDDTQIILNDDGTNFVITFNKDNMSKGAAVLATTTEHHFTIGDGGKWLNYLLDMDYVTGFKLIKEKFIKFDVPLPIGHIGLIREGVWLTSSAILINSNSIELLTGTQFDSHIVDGIKKSYFVDMERPFGVKVIWPDNFYVAEDINYIRLRHDCIPHTGFATEKQIKSKMKPSGGGFIPILLTKKELEKMKDSMFDINGRYADFWTHVIDDPEVKHPIFKKSSLIAAYAKKYRTSLHRQRFVKFRYKDQDMIRNSRLVYQAYQKTYDPIKQKFVQCCEQYGYLKHIVKSKEICYEKEQYK